MQWDLPHMYNKFNLIISYKNQPLLLTLHDWLEEKK